MTIVTAEIFVQAPVKSAYRAFTNSTSLREWLCDVCTVAPYPRGRMYLWWNGDFYSSGHYLELEENKNVKFRWFSSIDPAPTEVTVTVTEKDGGTIVRMDHQVPDNESWKNMAEGFRQNWADSLENLKSVLETGIDLRIANRPMLGITLGDFTADQAQAIGIPVTEGIRLDGVVDGMGAQKCGLQKEDVIVEIAGHTIRNDIGSLPVAIAGKKGGDKVEVAFYRGAERKKVTMELSKRPMPEIPFEPSELSKRARVIFESGITELEKCFEGVSDERAMKRPAPNEWSALETIAHLVYGERYNSLNLANLIDGYELVNDGFGNNVNEQLQAMVQANPSIRSMLGALRQASEETLAFMELIPQDFVRNNKGSYYRFGSNILIQPNFHFTVHLEQIRNAMVSAKG
jgi:uncharacterized protein YndB with AHSA1/START domain